MVKCHVRFIYKPNAFLILLGAFSDFEFLASPGNSFWTGFIRLFDMAECHVRFIYKPNAFLIILEAFL